MTVFQGSTSHQPPRQVNGVVRRQSYGRQTLSNDDNSGLRERLLVSRRAEGLRPSDRHSRGHEAAKRRTRTSYYGVFAHRQGPAADEAGFAQDGREGPRTRAESESTDQTLHKQSRDERLYNSRGQKRGPRHSREVRCLVSSEPLARRANRQRKSHYVWRPRRAVHRPEQSRKVQEDTLRLLRQLRR